MSGPGSAAVLAWTLDRCPSCGDPIAILTTDENKDLSIRLTTEDQSWLARGRHPAYSSHLKPMIGAMAERSHMLELRAEGDDVISSWLVMRTSEGPRRTHVSPGLALLIFELAQLPLWAAEDLLEDPSIEHFDDIQDSFAGFLSDVSPEDFERFDAHH